MLSSIVMAEAFHCSTGHSSHRLQAYGACGMYGQPLIGHLTSIFIRKYGHIVRLSPNKLSFAQPAAIRDIYGPNGLTQKSDLHLVSQQTSRGVAFPTLFSTTDSKWHDSVRRCVSFGFSMTTMVQY